MWWERETSAVACPHCGWSGWGPDLLDEGYDDPPGEAREGQSGGVSASYACPSCGRHVGVWAHRSTRDDARTRVPLAAESGHDELEWANRRIDGPGAGEDWWPEPPR